MNQVRMAIDKQAQSPDTQRPPDSATAQVQRLFFRSRNKGQRPSLNYVLPPRKKADELLETYWRLVHPLYPFLDKEETMTAYRCLWSGEAPGYDEPTFLCLLNVTFCLACVLGAAVSPTERSTSAELFFARACELLDFDLVQRASVLTVQCFLILGQYLQSTNDPQQCWIITGLALRIAQSLGLHLPSTTDHIQDTQKKGMLRRVWYGCVLMDRALSMTFGRPAMITTEAATSVPPPPAHEDISNCGCSGATFDQNEVPFDLHFFLESIKLYEILNQILLTLYTPSPREASADDPYEIYFGGSDATKIAAVFELDQKLLRWSRDLPSHLKYDKNTEKHAVHARQANVLWLRFRHIRILLFRPILSLFCLQQDKPAANLEEAMPQRIALQCSVMCVNIAQEVIEFFQSKIEALPDQSLDAILPAWWYNLFYVFTAATVLVAARFHPLITAEISGKAIGAAWQGALDVLKRLETFTKNAQRCATALKILFDKVSLQYDQQQQQQQTGPLPSDLQHMEAATVLHRTADPSTLAWPEGQFQNPASNNLYSAIPISESLSNVASTTDFFDNKDFSFDLNDMSWLNSVPFQLYNTGGVI